MQKRDRTGSPEAIPLTSLAADFIDFASQVVAPGATIHTDGARMFTRLADLGYTHHATP